MPITFACECGKQLKTAEENAGKRVKCPACGQPVAVPTPGSKPAAPARAPAAGAAAATVRFGCDCGKQLQAKPEMAGKRVKCPGCGAELTIPGPGGSPPPKPAAKPPDLAAATTRAPKPRKEPPPPPEPTDEGEESDFDQMPAAPKKKAAKPRSIVPLLVGALALLLVVGGAGAFGVWHFFFKEDHTKPLPNRGTPVAQRDKDAAKDKDAQKDNDAQKDKDAQKDRDAQKDAGQKDGPSKPPVPPPAAAPDLDLVPRDVLGFATIRVADVWDSPPGKKVRQDLPKEQLQMLEFFEKQMELTLNDIERLTVVMLAPDADNAYIVIRTSKPYDRAKVLAALAPGAVEEQHQGKTIHVVKDGPIPALHLVNEQILVGGPPSTLKRFLDQPAKPGESGPLSEALKQAAGKRHLVVGINPAPPMLDEARKSLPPDARPAFEPLLELKGGIITADLGNDLLLEASVLYPDDDRATKAADAARGAMLLARIGIGALKKEAEKTPAQAEVMKSLAPLEKALDMLLIAPKGPNVQVTLKTEGGVLPNLVASLLQAIIKGAAGAPPPPSSVNNLKQLAIAMHTYHAVNQRLPAGIRDKEGKLLLSWRVELLPYVEAVDLYKQFKLDEPWDSAHNKQLIARMPTVFAMPERPSPQPGLTYFQVFINAPGVPFNPASSAPFGGPQPPKLPASFPDGAANTLMIVEGGQGVIWSKPDDLAYDPKGPLPQLGDPARSGFLATLVDGSVRFVKGTVSEQTLRSAICPADGKPLGEDWNK